jgi:hypothetical protein
MQADRTEGITVTMTSELRVGVVGAGLMGADHVARLTHRIAGAAVSAVIEPDERRAAAADGSLNDLCPRRGGGEQRCHERGRHA